MLKGKVYMELQYQKWLITEHRCGAELESPHAKQEIPPKMSEDTTAEDLFDFHTLTHKQMMGDGGQSRKEYFSGICNTTKQQQQ